ncbi:putative quinol monooxygenase [Pedobacter gandavensis]|uniref:Antibiotic biosynthesis monooxygenase n=1 Tax=Pedobacter gandavensis TaxID=2679963 RepID=A0ABR6EUE4_9SPHI|nr:putative quinol monooxygenase [Pedobacter gandavensis]MBB2148895.1 antibiotic biosynthesis monooxygenase [Pedobacter gandavensis]
MNINLTAIIKSTEGNSDAMKALLLELLADSRKESACIQYDLHQDRENRNVFLFHEIWENQEGLDLHNSQPHIARFVSESVHIIDGPVIIHNTEKLA